MSVKEQKWVDKKRGVMFSFFMHLVREESGLKHVPIASRHSQGLSYREVITNIFVLKPVNHVALSLMENLQTGKCRHTNTECRLKCTQLSAFSRHIFFKIVRLKSLASTSI
jgi:hypothetical protein